jgi:purine-binding chemotaxis protein CheW
MANMSKTDTVKKAASVLQLVSFSLDKEVFAVDVMKVCGVERIMEITAIPGMPDFIEGVINLRNIRNLKSNTIVPVVDLRKKFNLPVRDRDKQSRIILVELDSRLVIGIIVDAVEEVFQIDHSMMDNVPRMGRQKLDNRYVKGVTQKNDRLIIIMDIEKVFSEEETKDLLSVM